MLALGFHRIEPPTGLEITRISPGRFRRLTDSVAEAHLPIGNPAGNLSSDTQEVWFTFDDGFASITQGALPELQRRGWPGLVFLIAGAMGKADDWDMRLLGRSRPMMSWDDVCHWSEQGMEFGSHTVTHADLTALSDRTLRNELRDSKAMIEDHTKRPVRFLSYPFGRHNQRVREAAARAGYEAGFTARWSNPLNGDPFAIPRRLVTGLTNLFEFRSWLEECMDPGRRDASSVFSMGAFFQSLSAGSATVGNWRRAGRPRTTLKTEIRKPELETNSR